MLPRGSLGRLVAGLAVLAMTGACSLKHLAVNRLGDALASGTSTFAEDEDPELVGGAAPFALKTTEALLAESPRHRGLLLAAASGFAQYAYAFVQQRADFLEAEDLARATQQRHRARRLFVRARDYGLRGLELDAPGLRERMLRDPVRAVAAIKKRNVPLLYWAGLAWFGAINLAKDDPSLTSDQQAAEALMRRALALDESFRAGALHDFFIAWEARGEVAGGSLERAEHHFRRAVELSGGARAWPFVTWAESACVARQDRKGFEEALERALTVDVDAVARYRLNNVVIQRRARWLLAREDELFIE
jgi:predicted anti-sigma-YlaC factor YlaD